MRLNDVNDACKTLADPARPSITPSFAFGIASWLGCAASYTIASRLNCAMCIYIGAGMAMADFPLLFCMVKRGIALALLGMLGILVGACLGLSSAAALHASVNEIDSGEEADVVFELLEDSKERVGSERALSRIVDGSRAGTVVRVDYRRCDELRYGQFVKAHCAFRELDDKTFDSCWRKGASCTAIASGTEAMQTNGIEGSLLSIRNRSIDVLCGDEGSRDPGKALLCAIICGYRRGISDSESYTAFQSCGLAHLIAVSGAHLVIVTGMIASILKHVRFPRRASILVLSLVMGSYLVISGMPISAVRACAMSALGLVSILGRRRPSSENALGVGIIAIIALNPTSAVSASFSLSALSTAGIIIFSPLFTCLLERSPFGRAPLVCETLSLTFSAGVTSQLYASSLFNQLPLASPLANLVTAPLFPVVCALGLTAAVAALLSMPFAAVVTSVAECFAQAMIHIVSMIADIPYACIPFSMPTEIALSITAVICAILWTFWPNDVKTIGRAFSISFAFACAVFIAHMNPQDRIVMLDVGQGDSFLIESRGQTLLIDTGNQDGLLLEGFANLGKAHVDSVLVTHADDDHYGSLDAMGKAIDVDRVLVADGMRESDDESCEAVMLQAGRTARSISSLAYGDTFCVGAFEAHVVWPNAFSEGGNADSICLLLEYDGNDDGVVDFTALFTGDAEKNELEQMIRSGDIGPVDILKVGHHGSRNGMTDDEVEILDPGIALISVGEGNRYGHPNAEIVSMLETRGCAVYRTDEDGEVTCTLSPDRISVRCVGLQ